MNGSSYVMIELTNSSVTHQMHLVKTQVHIPWDGIVDRDFSKIMKP
jgi:hypothetical protein